MKLIDAEKLTLELENTLNKIKENSNGEKNCDENFFVSRGEIMGINFALIEIANTLIDQPEIKIKEKMVCPDSWENPHRRLPEDGQNVMFIVKTGSDAEMLGDDVCVGHFAYCVNEKLGAKIPIFFNELRGNTNFYWAKDVDYWTPAPELPEGINGRSE